jgi:hypothetical protein
MPEARPEVEYSPPGAIGALPCERPVEVSITSQVTARRWFSGCDQDASRQTIVIAEERHWPAMKMSTFSVGEVGAGSGALDE